MNCDMAWLVVNEVGQIDTERPKQVSVWNVEEWAEEWEESIRVWTGDTWDREYNG